MLCFRNYEAQWNRMFVRLSTVTYKWVECIRSCFYFCLSMAFWIDFFRFPNRLFFGVRIGKIINARPKVGGAGKRENNFIMYKQYQCMFTALFIKRDIKK